MISKVECQLTKSIPHVDRLTIADWIALAGAISFKKMWAYNCWIAQTSFDLSQLSLSDWEAIAVSLDQPESWAYYRYKEFNR